MMTKTNCNIDSISFNSLPVKVDNHIEDAIDTDSNVGEVDEEDGEAEWTRAQELAQETHHHVLPLLGLEKY